jgi:hypothetical protein
MRNHQAGGLVVQSYFERTAMMAAKIDKGGNELRATLRKEIAKGANRHQLARLPAFRPVQDLPDHLRLLLARLEQSENVAP